jgi:methyl-accepting chemotaxis protein
MWTFGRKMAIGFAVSLALLVVIGVLAFRSIDRLTNTSYRVTHTHIVLETIAAVLSAAKDAETGQRGFVLTGQAAFLEPYDAAKAGLGQLIGRLRTLTADNPGQQRRLVAAEALVATKLDELDRSIDVRRRAGFDAALRLVESGEGKRYMDDLRRALEEMAGEERRLLETRAAEVESASQGGRVTLVAGTILALLAAAGVGTFLTRSLSRQIGSAVAQVQTSSAELQTVASQQATGSKEQATAMSQIATTIGELLATSRQITESARRVAEIAQTATSAAGAGDETVRQAQASMVRMQREMDQIAAHMQTLGETSQRIGAVLDIVGELSEQTNILAINATIEAAGAGEAGLRFGIVADEIRKLADRVADSTKEIRALIDEVRGAVDVTVASTAGGSRAVEAGSRQFDQVTAAFGQIAALVDTTRQAGREIELSTKQQMSAVEQVNQAIVGIAQASRETEASAGQTQQTASQLADLSSDLLRLIKPAAAA